jgi:hypothetical protein
MFIRDDFYLVTDFNLSALDLYADTLSTSVFSPTHFMSAILLTG